MSIKIVTVYTPWPRPSLSRNLKKKYWTNRQKCICWGIHCGVIWNNPSAQSIRDLSNKLHHIHIVKYLEANKKNNAGLYNNIERYPLYSWI